MKKLILFLLSVFLLANHGSASEICFLAKENEKILKSEGECSKAYGPQCSFNVALSLIGFDSGILKNENSPSWSLPKDADYYIRVCKGDHNPRTWMRDSCIWYSKVLTSKLGIEKFQDYVNKFSYGNKDLSGGVKDAWISSSLKISPEEQLEFLQKMVDRKFPLSKESYENTSKIMFMQEMSGGWKLYGKTGNGSLIDENGNKTELQQGWFVGYIEKDNRKIVFVSHVTDTEKQNIFASFRARNEALNKLWYLINDQL